MTSSVAYCLLISAATAVVVLSATSPSILGDSNEFLKGFVNHELLNILGVIIAITIASTAQIHLNFNQLEEKYQKRGFQRARAGVQRAAYVLVWLFVLGVLVVVSKPLMAREEWVQSIFNGSALIILLWNLLILVSLTQGVFAIKSDVKDDG